MKQIATRYRALFFLMLNITMIGSISGQNLILDPGAETDPRWNGWTVKSGNWLMGNSTNDGPATPHGGNEFFYAELESYAVNDTSELYQDINVSSNAASINAGTAVYTFSGWMRIFDFEKPTPFAASQPNDIGVIIVEYRNAASQVLSSYNTGHNTSLTWQEYTNVTTAPVGTTDIRIRLLSLWVQGTDSDGYMDDLSLTVNTPAPVKLLIFDAVPDNDSVAVSWSTASEENNAYFTVQKSIDGISWIDVKSIPGAGNSNSVLNYLTYDNDPLPGTSYYRLKQTDMNGNFSFSSIVSVSFTSLSYQLFPNPATTELHLKGLLNGSYSVSCFSVSGQAVSLPIKSVSDDEAVYDTSQLSSSLYVLLIHTNTKTLTARFVVK